MFKKKFIFLILSSVLIVSILCSCKDENIKEDTISGKLIDEEVIAINEHSINKDEKDQKVSNITKWKDLKSLEDIKEDMIINKSIGSFFATYGSTPKTNGFSLKFSKFTGVNHYISINAQNYCDVVLSIEDSDIKDDFKAYLILSNGDIIEILKDPSENEIKYSITQGTNIIALSGYKATGTFNIDIKSEEEIELKKID